MKILVVGSGGREHALARTLASEPGTTEVLCAPGNPGTAGFARSMRAEAADVEALAAVAAAERVDLTVVGPELPLDRGIADLFSARGLRIFGPTRAAARLECSKVFAKQFMARHGIPTARFRCCESAEDARAVAASGELGLPLVVKADGLAAGKGVVVAASRAEADAAIAAAMDDRLFGDAGARIVLEECLEGPEVSFFAICDGTRALALGSAQDHKRVFDEDRGPNTGGMGAFAPSPLLDLPLEEQIMREIVEPVLAGMRADGHEFRGFLYVGLMLTCQGPKVIEFNVRLGDPEAQVLLPSILTPLAPLLAAAADGRLPHAAVEVSCDKFVGVVLASRGYPGAVTAGTPIRGIAEAAGLPDVFVFHSGTARDAGGGVITAGGRVLTVVGTGPAYEDAIFRAYEATARISFDGMHYRRDIGRKALKTTSHV